MKTEINEAAMISMGWNAQVPIEICSRKTRVIVLFLFRALLSPANAENPNEKRHTKQKNRTASWNGEKVRKNDGKKWMTFSTLMNAYYTLSSISRRLMTNG